MNFDASKVRVMLLGLIHDHNFQNKIGIDGNEVSVRKFGRGVCCGCKHCRAAYVLLEVDPLDPEGQMP